MNKLHNMNRQNRETKSHSYRSRDLTLKAAFPVLPYSKTGFNNQKQSGDKGQYINQDRIQITGC